jgi:hypothetical protein
MGKILDYWRTLALATTVRAPPSTFRKNPIPPPADAGRIISAEGS